MIRNIKVHIIAALCAAAMPLTAGAKTNGAMQQSARDFFCNDSSAIFSLLPHNQRLEMLYYYDSGRIMDTKNAFEGKSRLTNASTSLVRVELTPATIVEVWMPDTTRATAPTVICSTYSLPVADSRITVLDAAGNTTNKVFTEPTILDFITAGKGDALTPSEIAEIADIAMISYSINPEAKTIVATLNAQDFMSAEQYKRISKYLRPSITYHYTAGKFKPKK